MLKLHSLIVLGLLIIAGVAAAAPSAHMVTIKVSSGLSAKILVSPSGMTLYHYIDEKKRSIECTGSCAKLWPPLLAGSTKPVAGPGLAAAKLGTIKRPDGGVQVTYNGLALYRYSADTKPGQTKGQGVGGVWFAVTSAGSITKAKVTTALNPAATTTSSGGNSSTGTPPAAPGAGNANQNCAGVVNDFNPNEPCYNY